MASNQLVDFDFTTDYFNFKKIYSACRKDHKTFKISQSPTITMVSAS